jgi:tetratricopeptide (TPR) repeat protein
MAARNVSGGRHRHRGPAWIAAVLSAAALAAPARAGRAAEVRVESFRLLNEGVSAYERGLYDEAVEKLGRCSAISLSSFRPYYYYGLALTATRRYAEAVEALRIALELEPQDLMALVALGDALLQLGDVDEARAAYARAIKARPAHAPALDGLARSYEAQADDDRALDHYRQAILSNKGFAPAYTHLGDLHLRHGRVREAVTLLEEAVAIRPDFAWGHNRLAVAYGRLGLLNEAVATVQKAIDLAPTDPSHPETLGWLQLDQALLAAAEHSFERALGLNAALPESRIGLAQVERRRGDYASALLHVATALALPDLGTKIIDRLAVLRAELEAEALRAALLESRIASGEGTPEERGELAAILARRGQWNEAAELQRAPASPEQEEWLAYLLFQAGRYREAHGIWSRLVSAAPEEARLDLRLNAGVALALLGDDAAAAEAFRGVLDAEPGHGLARLYLANALLRQGQTAAAARDYRAYLETDASSAAAERVRRILRQVAPELLPATDAEPLVPPSTAPQSGEGGAS